MQWGLGFVLHKFLAGYVDSPIPGLAPLRADFESTNNGHLRPNVTLTKDPQGVDTYLHSTSRLKNSRQRERIIKQATEMGPGDERAGPGRLCGQGHSKPLFSSKSLRVTVTHSFELLQTQHHKLS